MKILTILGTGHQGNTRAIVDLFLEQFKENGNEFDEVTLPKDMPHFCYGCANCILKGEKTCPHFQQIDPIVEKIEAADLLIIATPVFVMSCTSGLKALLDHLAYMWLVHRPKETMFRKVGLIITTAGGSGVKDTTRLIKNNLFYWGIPQIYHYGVTTLKMRGNYSQYPQKDKIQLEVKRKTKKIKRSLRSRKVALKTKLFFNIFKMTQKKGWNKADSDYWKSNGWLNGVKPYSEKKK